MDIEELGRRLESLETAKRVADEQAQQSMFIDKYGTKFNKNPDLAVAILGELNRRGVDVSAADDAVQQIMDQLRMELTQAMDRVQQMVTDLSATMDKVNTVDEAVQAAQGSTGVATEAPGEQDMLPDLTYGMAPASTPETPAPAPMPETPAPAAVPEETPAPAAVPETPAPAAAPMSEAPAPAPIPQGATLSDERMKNVQQPNANDAEDIIAKLNYYRSIPEDQLNADMKANKEYYEEQYAALMANRGKYNKDMNSDTRNSVRQINEEYTRNTVSDERMKANKQSTWSAGMLAAARGL